jgi:ABC-type multidrug transport system fused ATPase/permease subunit
VRHLRRLTPYLRIHRRTLALALICALASAALVMVSPVLIGWAIDFGLDPARDAEGTVTSLEGNERFLIIAALSVVAFAVGRGVSSFAQQYLAESVGQKVAYSIRNDIYQNLQRLSYAYHDKTHTGQIMSRATQDVENIRIFINMGFIRLFYIGLLVIIATIGMLVINWQLALVSFISIPIIAWRSIVSSNKMRPLWMKIQENQAQMTQVAEEGLSGIRVVKAFSQEPYESQKFRATAQQQADLSYAQARYMAQHGPLMTGLSMLQVAVTVGFGSLLIANENLTAGGLLTFVLWLSLLQLPIRSLGFVISIGARAVSSSERVFELLDARSAVQEKQGAPELHPKGHVRFNNVTFGYNARNPVVKDVTIDAPPGKVVALLGPTGSGKSTLVNLLPRFYDVTEGSITIDDTDIRDVTLDSLRKSIGIVQQDVFLFLGTIRDNIAYGNPDATQEQVENAAKAARIHDFIVSLPYGYDEWVGENGVTLSGGQKQRIAIARTLLLDPRILIFDDSTSSVDSQTEYLIQQALEELMKGRTTFVIAQRLRTVRDADEIIVLDKGNVVQRGTHDELHQQPGLYRNIYELEIKVREEGYDEAAALTTNGAASNGAPAAQHTNGTGKASEAETQSQPAGTPGGGAS